MTEEKQGGHMMAGAPAHLFGQAVVFNGGAGKEHQLAFVEHNHGGNVVDLVVWDDGAFTGKTSVPERDPKDYGPEGGGYTWHFHA